MSPAWALCKEARRRAGLSQRELAARVGVSPSTVGRIERGRVEPTLNLLVLLLRGCRLELRMQLCPEELPEPAPSNLDFEARLSELHNLSEMTLEARRNVVA